MDTSNPQAAFMDAWRQAIALSERPQLFSPATLAPDVKEITRRLPNMPMTHAAWLATLVGFYNPVSGAKLAGKCSINSFADLALALPDEHRQVLGDLIRHYRGWRA